MLLDLFKGAVGNIVLDLAGFLGGGDFVHPQSGQHQGQHLMALVNPLGHGHTGIGQSREAFTTSPELTTNGMLPKAWRF